jgi:hypothetical protein
MLNEAYEVPFEARVYQSYLSGIKNHWRTSLYQQVVKEAQSLQCEDVEKIEFRRHMYRTLELDIENIIKIAETLQVEAIMVSVGLQSNKNLFSANNFTIVNSKSL